MSEEFSRFKLLVTVNAEQSVSEGGVRQEFANLIGQRILDAWHGTNIASEMAIDTEVIDDLVEVHKELLYCERAVLILDDERIQYQFEVSDELLAEAAQFIEHEVLERKAQRSAGYRGGQLGEP